MTPLPRPRAVSRWGHAGHPPGRAQPAGAGKAVLEYRSQRVAQACEMLIAQDPTLRVVEIGKGNGQIDVGNAQPAAGQPGTEPPEGPEHGIGQAGQQAQNEQEQPGGNVEDLFQIGIGPGSRRRVPARSADPGQ